MNKTYSILLVTAGAALIVAALSGPVPLALTDFFTRAPSSHKVWLLLVGTVVTAAGLYRACSDRSRHD